LAQNSKEDVRIQRTRELLQQALFALTVERGFTAVTVHDIAERARVNRSTFYRHYLDKHDLLKHYFDMLQAQTVEAASLAEQRAQTGSERVPLGLLIVIKQVQQYADFYRVMLGSNGDPLFAQRFRQLTENRYRLLFARQGEAVDPNSPPIAMRLNYISAAGVGAILWWLENQQPCTPEQLAIWLGQLGKAAAFSHPAAP
jgi:AcrR family transcriptional regulator